MIKEILEYFYFLSGPVIALLAFKGLHQIIVSKEIAKTNAKRDAFKLTAEQCKYYGENIIPLVNELDKSIATHNAQLFTKSKYIIENNNIKVIPNSDYPEFDETIQNLVVELSNVYNALNSFSLFFVSGVADENLAYMTLGKTYCNTVERLLPFLVNASTYSGEDNILSLFLIWHHRKNKEKAIKEKQALEKQIKETSDIRIKPIGT